MAAVIDRPLCMAGEARAAVPAAAFRQLRSRILRLSGALDRVVAAGADTDSPSAGTETRS